MAQLDKFKLSQLFWDSDDPKTKDDGHLHIENFGSLVRSTEHGNDLESMLDSKLERQPFLSQAVPSFILNDPDFAPPAARRAAAPADSGSASDESPESPVPRSQAQSGASGNFTLVPYQDLSADARALDGVLYNMFKMSVRGSKQQLLNCVIFPSYVQAVCLLENICRSLECNK